MDPSIRKRALAWARNPHVEEEGRLEVRRLLDAGREEELAERFHRDLAFGTGGMRGVLGQGTSRINRRNVRRAAQAVAQEALARHRGAGPPGAVVAHDPRELSRELAAEAAGVLAGNGLRVLLFDGPAPVPLLSFAVRREKARAGIMITASHNPPEYNGLKAYWSGGAQATPPVDAAIAARYGSLDDGDVRRTDPVRALARGDIRRAGPEVEESYVREVAARSPDPSLCRERGGELGVAFSALHGAGGRPCAALLSALGFARVEPVPAQDAPDGRFPTVASPNPEDPEAMAAAMGLMRERGLDVALATDPDADRVGVACLHRGGAARLNGNQAAAVLLHYVLGRLAARGALPGDPVFLRSAVTSPLLDRIAAAHGVRTEETPTGFKWIGRRMEEMASGPAPRPGFVFAAEESLGYLHHDLVRDKDGVASAALLAEAALHHKTEGRTLADALDLVHREFGHSHEALLAISFGGREGAAKIARIMARFREGPAHRVLGMEASSRDDLLEGTRSFADGRPPEPLGLPAGDMLGYGLAGGGRLFLRPSGTEPKVKFYLSIQSPPGTPPDEAARRARAAEKRAFALAREEAARA